MNSTFLRALLLVLLLVCFQGVAWTNTEEAAEQLGADKVSEVTFEKNSFVLTDAQKAALRKAVSEAGTRGKIKKIRLLAWSDEAYPPPKAQQSKEDVRLAKERIRGLKSFLKGDLKLSNVATYNMAQRPDALENFFKTSDAKVKIAAEAAGLAPRASKGVVMIFVK